MRRAFLSPYGGIGASDSAASHGATSFSAGFNHLTVA